MKLIPEAEAEEEEEEEDKEEIGVKGAVHGRGGVNVKASLLAVNMVMVNKLFFFCLACLAKEFTMQLIGN